MAGRRFVTHGWLLFALASACATPAGPPPRPALSLQADHFVGSIHTGPLAESAPSALGSPWWIAIRVAYVDAPPSDATEPVSAGARQVFVELGDEPLRSRSELALGILCASGGPAAAAQAATPASVDPVWTGTTTSWRATPGADGEDPPRPRWSSLELQISRPADPLGAAELALVLEGESNVREHVVLDAPSTPDAPALLLFLPAPRPRCPGGGFRLELERIEASTPVEAAATLERASSSLVRSTARAREGTGRLTREEGFRFESSSALRALEDEELHRSALAFLAQACGATATGELAILAADGPLDVYLQAMKDRVAGTALDASEPEALAWQLESATCTWLAARAADEKRPIEPELRALLLVRAGELARFPDLLREAVEESDSLAGFDRRLAAENRIFLEDADPAARLRAFEWLQGRGAAPEGFDPLAPLAARRAALDRARAGETAEPEPQGGGAR